MICSEAQLDERQSTVRIRRCPSCLGTTVLSGKCGICEPRIVEERKIRTVIQGSTRHVVLVIASEISPTRPAPVSRRSSVNNKIASQYLSAACREGTMVMEDGRAVSVTKDSGGYYTVTFGPYPEEEEDEGDYEL